MKIFFCSTVFWSVKSSKDETLNGFDKRQKILGMQADHPLVFWPIVCFSYAK